ncbi:MAG: UDP-N-acetylmuramoyl-L-alanine--D-glutamate ligase [Bacteroidota bacterium]|jgi:UDP-N-acetylmuramoylalanine--D-glutamate ligase|nr:UDP-N-acetylmuramoyl-L-alanine--D-glutamate ligase [Bacteroidota bacterium]HHU97741.1 UDP-N-acetylmuramoyl-L-alanine--D-glutamate ligase [Petrimonas sp.]
MSNRRFVVLGGGESGVGAALLAKEKGFEVFLSDFGSLHDAHRETLQLHGIDFEEGRHTEARILQAVEVVKSPGIPDSAPIVRAIRERGIPVISEIEFASRYTDAKIICVTGSNGKSTTASLIHHILKSAGLNVALAGNIGKSFARLVVEDEFEYYVLELSSFQLEGVYDFKADIAVLLNITPDHLDRYGNDLQRYIDAKMRIIRNQEVNDALIYWIDDPILNREIERLKPKATRYPFGATKPFGTTNLLGVNNLHEPNTAFDLNVQLAGYVDGGKLWIDVKEERFDMELELLALEGMHNVYNSLASGIVAKLMDITDEQLRASLSDFKGIPHRLENVATVRGVLYVNDSKATNVNSCWYALQSTRSKTVLILGGKDKGNDYTEIEELVLTKVRALIFLGKDNSRLHAFFDGKIDTIVDTDSMKEAVNSAYELAQKGDTVLLSPCCASFDLFKNYEDRGDQFKEHVRRL